jgi:hypothetical protein
MNSATANKARMALPDDFSWRPSVGLLLDAVQVEHLLQRLFEWNPLPAVEVLYLGTRLAEFRDVSPCLVRLTGPNDPILAQFLVNLGQQWGYLLVSDAPWPQVVAHLRWLTVVEHPSGQELLLRIAYPETVKALFAPTCSDSALFGPCQNIFVASHAEGSWHQYSRFGEIPEPNHAVPYRLSEKQWASLDNASAEKRLNELARHMQHYFPDYRAELTLEQRREHLRALTDRAAELGFHSETDVQLFADAHGYLNQPTLLDPQSIALLTQPNASTTAAAIAAAAQKRSQP